MTEINYFTENKSSWPSGPWHDEPDKVQWTDKATSLQCLVVRVDHSGHLCGYVGVSPGHPAYGLEYDKLQNIKVHWGLTYSRACSHGPEATSICHRPEPGRPDNVWWLGFDCAHSGDLLPKSNDICYWQNAGYIYRDMAFVRTEVESLGHQLQLMAEPAP